MEIEWENPMMWTVVVSMYGFCMLVLWKWGDALGEWPLISKVAITFLAAPILFFIINAQLNR